MSRALLVGLVWGLALALTLPVWGQQQPPPGPRPGGGRDQATPTPTPEPRAPREVPQRVVALLRGRDPATARQAADALARRHTLRVEVLYPLFSADATLAVFVIPDARLPRDVAAVLRGSAEVMTADVNTIYDTQGDPLAPRQYALAVVGADRVHSVLQGRNVTLAVVDTGVFTRHEDLRGAVARQESLIEGQSRLVAGAHGTGVVGLIAARRDNNRGIIGVAPQARIIALQACTPVRPDAEAAECVAHRVARAIDLAVRYRARAVNLSMGAGPNLVVAAVVIFAWTVHRVPLVAAAGNNGPDGPALYPAALPGVVAVGATDHQDAPYERSSRGAHVALLAPGKDVLTTSPGDRYLFRSGTSYAAAYATGALAVLLEAAPRATAADLVAALRDGGAVVPGQVARRVDLCGALVVLGRTDVCR